MNRKTLVLLCSLILLVVALAAVSLGYTSSLRGAFPSIDSITPKAQPQGNLMVRAFYANGTPVSNATVLTRNLATRVVVAIPYHTDSNGVLKVTEAPGQYVVSVRNDQFQSSTTLQVSEGNTTLLDVNVTQTIRASVFNALRTTGTSGFAPPWEQVVVAIPADTTFYHPGDTVFIQRFLSTNCPCNGLQNGNGNSTTIIFPINASATLFRFGNLQNNPEIRAEVVSSDLRDEIGPSLLWLTLQINAFLPVDLSPGLQLVTYSATTQVSMRAG